MLNSISIAGHLGQDAEEKQIGDFTLVNLSIAVSDYRKKEKVTDWFRVTVWGELPKWKLDALTKGAVVAVKGKMISRQYENKDGVKVTAWDVEARAFDVSVAKATAEAGSQAPHAAAKPAYPQQPQKPEAYNDDLPF
jgi:single-strand DNA-binding protein